MKNDKENLLELWGINKTPNLYIKGVWRTREREQKFKEIMIEILPNLGKHAKIQV
jgi:hypothetical protein